MLAGPGVQSKCAAVVRNGSQGGQHRQPNQGRGAGDQHGDSEPPARDDMHERSCSPNDWIGEHAGNLALFFQKTVAFFVAFLPRRHFRGRAVTRSVARCLTQPLMETRRPRRVQAGIMQLNCAFWMTSAITKWCVGPAPFRRVQEAPIRRAQGLRHRRQAQSPERVEELPGHNSPGDGPPTSGGPTFDCTVVLKEMNATRASRLHDRACNTRQNQA